MKEIRVVLLGRTGAGKSCTGNTILGKLAFESSTSLTSVTRKCRMGSGPVAGHDILVIDTPGLFDTELSEEVITSEVVKCIGMTAPGPQVFVMVIRIDRFTAEENDTIDHFKKVFGEAILKHMVVLFTRKDDLIHHGKTIQDYLLNAPTPLKDLLASCDNRYAAFNNRGSESERKEDVHRFMKVITDMMDWNGGIYYSDANFERAEQLMKEREDQIRQDKEREAIRRRTEIEEECEKELSEMMENKLEITKPLEEAIQKSESAIKKSASSQDIQRLKTEVVEMKKALEETKRETDIAREKIKHDAEMKKGGCADNDSSCRDIAREEVCLESSIIMLILGGLKSDVAKKMFSQIGSAIADGVAGVVTAAFDGVVQNIKTDM